MIGVILVIRPPSIFPQNPPKLQFLQQSKKTNQTFMAGENKSRMEIETFHWTGVEFRGILYWWPYERLNKISQRD